MAVVSNEAYQHQCENLLWCGGFRVTGVIMNLVQQIRIPELGQLQQLRFRHRLTVLLVTLLGSTKLQASKGRV